MERETKTNVEMKRETKNKCRTSKRIPDIRNAYNRTNFEIA